MLLTVHLDFWQLSIKMSILRGQVGQVKKLHEGLSVYDYLQPG